MTSSGPRPAGASFGDPVNKPLNKKMTSSGPRPAGATSGAPADKPLNQNHAYRLHRAGAPAQLTQCTQQARTHRMHPAGGKSVILTLLVDGVKKYDIGPKTACVKLFAGAVNLRFFGVRSAGGIIVSTVSQVAHLFFRP